MSLADPNHLRRVQRIRKATLFLALLAALGLAIVSRSFGGDTFAHEEIEAVGLAMIAICVVGRAWCSLYIGGRKKAEIVDRGPYSVTRNPLYVFSFIGAFGVGAQTGTLTMAAVFLLITMGVFYLTVRQERGVAGKRFWPVLPGLPCAHPAVLARPSSLARHRNSGGQAGVLPDHAARRLGLLPGRAFVRGA